MTGRSEPKLQRIGFGLGVAAAVAALTACQGVEAKERVFKSESKVSVIEKGDPHKTVTLTQKGIDQIGLKTEIVRGTEEEKVIPYSALLYEADGGHTYVFTNPEGRSYKRGEVKVIRIDADRVFLSEGPPLGSRVVTQGLAQVHGAELEFGKY